LSWEERFWNVEFKSLGDWRRNFRDNAGLCEEKIRFFLLCEGGLEHLLPVIEEKVLCR